MGRKTGKKITEQKNADAVIKMQEDLDLANAEIKRLMNTIALVERQLRLIALCLEVKDG